MSAGGQQQQQQPPVDKRNWKLLVDPLLKKGLPKLFRFDGCCQAGHGNSAYNVTVVSDPRTHIPRFYARSEPCDLLLPSFKIDADYVGVPPARQVSFFELNDNINEQFLTELCRKAGEVNEAKIYFNPETKKHLGIARVVFRHVRGARSAVERYNGASVMGGTIRCLLDPFGREVKQRYSELTTATAVHSPLAAAEPPTARRSISHPVPEAAKPSPAAASFAPQSAPVAIGSNADWAMHPPPPLGHWPPPTNSLNPLWPPPPVPPTLPPWTLPSDLHQPPPIEPTPADPSPSSSAQHPPLSARHDFTADIVHKVEELKQLGEDQKKQVPSTSRTAAANDGHTDGPSTSIKRDYYGEQVRSDRNDDGRKSREKSRTSDRHGNSRKRRASSSASSCDTVDLYDRGRRHKKDRRSKRSHSREPSYVEVEEKYYRRKKAGHHSKDYYRYKCRTKGVGGDDDHMDSPDFIDEIEQYKLISRRYKRRGDGRHSADKKTATAADGGLESVSSGSEDDGRDRRSRSKHSASRRRSRDRDSASRRRHRSSSSSSISSPSSRLARRHKRRRGSEDDRRSKPARAAGQHRVPGAPVPPLADAHVENVSESETSGDDVEVDKCASAAGPSWSIESAATRATFSLDSRIQSILGDHLPIAPSCIPMPPEPPKMTPEQEATPSDATDNISSSATPRQMAPGVDGSPVWAQSPTPGVFWSPKTTPAPPFPLPPLGFPPPPPGLFHPIMSRFPPPSWVMPPSSSTTTTNGSREKRNLVEKTKAPKDDEAAVRSTSKAAVDGVVNDLRAVLRKDLTRRLIENAAFRTIDAWWSVDRRQERKLDRAPQMPTTPNRPVKTATAENDLVASVQSTTTESMSATLSQLFDKETLGSGGLSGLPGFGLRAAMPKLPSFKKRQLPPARPRTPDSSGDESSEKRSRRRKRRVSPISRSQSPSRSASSRRSSRSSSSSSSSSASSSARRRRSTAVDQDELHVEKIESSDDDEDTKVDAELDRVSSSESKSDESESEHSESSSSSSDDEVDDEEEAEARPSAEATREPSVDTDDRSNSQSDSLSSSGAAIVEPISAKQQHAQLPKKREPSNPLEPLETMAVVDEYAPMLYDHCYIKEMPIEPPPPPTPVVEPRQPLRPVSPPSIASAAQPAATMVIKTEEAVEFKPPPPKKRKKTFPRRSIADEEEILRKFETEGFDEEDLGWLRIAFEQLRKNDETPWAHKLCWLNPPSVPSGLTENGPVKVAGRRNARKSEDTPIEIQHKTGCARTEGYYKLSHKQKRSLVRRAECTFERTAIQSEQDVTAARQQAQAGREARSMQRRILTSLGTDVGAESELLKVNQLKYRKKMIKFARSQIHGWGLYALETIAPDEMIVEYVGQKIRFNVADKREKNYEKIGIGSSYLFRIDADQVIDATKRGNLARFINHSCQPNCYAKIVTVDGDKRIVIYSKGLIKQGEEITYDYKFPVEEDKIDCLCGAPGCRGTLN